MSSLASLGLGLERRVASAGLKTEHIHVHRPLRRVMAFLRCSIDDVCNDRIVKNQVYGYYKLYHQINRSIEVGELERQWNPLGL